MGRIIKRAFYAAIMIALVFVVSRFLVIKTVYYEIAGTKIPSRYNAITKKVSPIKDYKGRTDLPTIQPRMTNRSGMSNDEVTFAKFRWAVFEQWIKSHPEFKGWQEDNDLFKKANEQFLKEMQAYKGKVVIIQ